MHRRRARPRPVRPAVVALAAALTLAGCSSAGGSMEAVSTTGGSTGTSRATAATPSADEVLDKARAALAGATTARMAGTIEDGGSTVTLDIAGRTDGTSAQGSIETSEVTLQFVLVGGQTYLRGDRRFWSSAGIPAERAKQLAGSQRWLKASEAQATSFTRLANPRTVLGDLLDSRTSSSQQVSATTSDGTQCWTVTDRASASAFVVDVERSTFLPLRLVLGQGRNLSFSEWNSVPDPQPPAASQVISG